MGEFSKIKNLHRINEKEFEKKKADNEAIKNNKKKLDERKKKEMKQTQENNELLIVDSIINILKSIEKNEDTINKIRAQKGMKQFETKKINYDLLKNKNRKDLQKKKCLAFVLF